MTNSDKRSLLMAYGYVRGASLLLGSPNNTYHSIPDDITNLVLSYIANYYRNYGEYTWKIDNLQTLQSMANPHKGDVFHSPIFKMAKIKWQISIYPKGNDKIVDRFVVCLKPLIFFHSNWDKLVFLRTVEFQEEKYKFSLISSKRMGETATIISNTFSLSRLLQIGSITLKISVDILKIILKLSMQTDITAISSHDRPQYPKKVQFTHYIRKSELKELMDKTHGMPHSTPILNNMWFFAFFPHGAPYEYNAYCSTVLYLCFWPQNVCGFKVNYKITCRETGHSVIKNNVCFMMNGKGKAWHAIYKWFPDSELKYIDAITLDIEIEIREEMLNETKLNEINDEIQLSNMLLNANDIQNK